MSTKDVWCQRCRVVVSDAGVCPQCGVDRSAPLPPELEKLRREVLAVLPPRRK